MEDFVNSKTIQYLQESFIIYPKTEPQEQSLHFLV